MKNKLKLVKSKKPEPIVIEPELLDLLTKEYNKGNSCIYHPLTNTWTISINNPMELSQLILNGILNGKLNK